MQTRTFSNSGQNISEVGLGCWQFGGDFGDVTDQQCLDTLSAAVADLAKIPYVTVGATCNHFD